MQCLPIPQLIVNLKAGQKDHGWKKLTTFEENLHGLHGTALFIDLDVVIVGSSETRVLPRPGNGTWVYTPRRYPDR